MQSFRLNKRKIDFDSPKMKLKRVLDFEDSPVKPKKLFTYIDENSCGTAFSEHSDDDFSQATNLDESFDQFDSDNDEIKQETIKINNSSTDSSSERLIGDMSRHHTLPILSKSRHSDLASIEPNTLADLINGKYNDKIGKYLILDARYPYEFNGGHVTGAESAYFKEDLIEKLFKKPIRSQDGKPVILVFHCEFSIERGPKLMREIREKDRSLNKHNYPNLFYPEIYLLEGGYKNFYETNVKHCEPQSYMPMLHNEFRTDMKYFRKKSKTWELETRKTKCVIKSRLDF